MGEIPLWDRASCVCPHCYAVFSAATMDIVQECPSCHYAVEEKDIVYGLNEIHSYALAMAVANEMKKKREVGKEIEDAEGVK